MTLDEFRAFFLGRVDAFNRRDLDAVLDGLPEEFEWHFPEGVVDRPEPARPSKLRHALDDLVAPLPDLTAEPFEIVEPVPDSFVVRLHVHGAGATSGASTQLELVQLWEFEGDRPVRVREFTDFSVALAEARA